MFSFKPNWSNVILCFPSILFPNLYPLFKKMFYLALQKDCPSGQLTRSKFLDIYQAMFPDGKAGAFYEHVFRTFDEDGSGKIDFKEFLQVSIEKSEKR